MTYQTSWVVGLLLLAVATNAFTLEGTWQYQHAPGSFSDQSVTLTVEDYVFREGTILQKMTFKGCREILLQAQFS